MRRYVYALVSAVLASIARVLLDRVIGYHHPYATFYIAVLWSAWYGGLGPALLATALGALAAIVLVLPPPFVAAQGSGTLVGFEFYFLVSLTGAILLHKQRKAERKSAHNAQVARDRLAALERETSQRRQQEQAAREFEDQLRLAFEHAPVGICHIAMDGRVIEANARLCEITGYTHNEILGIDFFQIVESDAPVVAAEEYKRLKHGAAPVQKGEYSLVCKDGRVISVEVAISMLWAKTGDPRCAVAIVEDITARKRSEEQLREAQKLESVALLAGGIAHDFNNLLTGILGNAALAVDAIPHESESRRMLDAVISAAMRAAELTAQLLAYAGKGAFVTGRVDLSALVCTSLKLVAPSLPPNVTIHLNPRDALPSIRADASQIQQLFTNLVINSGEAILEGQPGRITVTTDFLRVETEFPAHPIVGEVHPGDYILLRVEDNGRGMHAATMKRIFDPFFTTKFLGRGLGLAAVSGIVRSQKGAVLVSSSPGHGSTFSVLLPVPAGTAGNYATPAKRYFGAKYTSQQNANGLARAGDPSRTSPPMACGPAAKTSPVA